MWLTKHLWLLVLLLLTSLKENESILYANHQASFLIAVWQGLHKHVSIVICSYKALKFCQTSGPASHILKGIFLNYGICVFIRVSAASGDQI